MLRALFAVEVARSAGQSGAGPPHSKLNRNLIYQVIKKIELTGVMVKV